VLLSLTVSLTNVANVNDPLMMPFGAIHEAFDVTKGNNNMISNLFLNFLWPSNLTVHYFAVA
jgi:hypothetical protein